MFNKKQILLIAGALILGVGLYNLPIIPQSKQQVMVEETSSDQVKLAEAVALVQGDNPMKGITMLREMLQENPENIDVMRHLAHFSIQSGQYEKAIERFNQILAIDTVHYTDAYFYLGRTYATINDTASAVQCFEKYKTLVNDTVVLAGVDRFIKELRNK